MYHAACKVEFQPFKRSYSQLTFSNLKKKITFKLVELSIINTSYQKFPFGSGDDADKLLFHQALN